MTDPLMRMNDGRSAVVHYVTERTYPVDHGGGDVRTEEADCTLCDRWVGYGWFEQDLDTPVTCIACLAEAHLYALYPLITVSRDVAC